MTTRKLPDDFPGLAALEAAGEATVAKVRKRIADGALTEIPGIGEATAEKIEEAFAAVDTPADQAADAKEIENDENITPASQAEAIEAAAAGAAQEVAPIAAAEVQAGATKPSLLQRVRTAIDDKDAKALEDMGGEIDTALEAEQAEMERHRTTTGTPAGRDTGGTLVHDGTVSDDALAAGRAEAEKSGVQKNVEIENHALDKGTAVQQSANRMAATDGERLARSGAVFVDHPNGSYASKTAVRFSQDDGRVKVLPIAHVSPQNGMEVRDGDDVYVLQTGFNRDALPIDWLRVRSPNTGAPLID
jgi:hypothetical protein